MAVQVVQLSASSEAHGQEGWISLMRKVSPIKKWCKLAISPSSIHTKCKDGYIDSECKHEAVMCPLCKDHVPHLAQRCQVVFKLKAIVLSRGFQVVSILGWEPWRWRRLCTAVQVASPTLWLLQGSDNGWIVMCKERNKFEIWNKNRKKSMLPSWLGSQLYILTDQCSRWPLRCDRSLWLVLSFCILCTILKWRHKLWNNVS